MINVKSLVPGDVVSFLAADNKYKAILCTGVYNERSPHSYNFAATTYSSDCKPSLEDIIQAGFYGVATKENEYFPYSEAELENMWKIHPEIKPYVLGSYGFIVWRKDLRDFQNNLHMVGHIKIINNLDKKGNGSVNASSWAFLYEFFSDTRIVILSERGQRIYSLQSIINE